MGVGRVRSCEFNHDRVVIDSFGVGAYQYSVDSSPLIREAYLPGSRWDRTITTKRDQSLRVRCLTGHDHEIGSSHQKSTP
jgi:hypothetical protein